ncbi:MAG: hypothetical protein QY332_10330 [Anaerolineales bacterium]|nr:MAG: hypothetical protein QY332_10330 [Anaerolineales bacterium]
MAVFIRHPGLTWDDEHYTGGLPEIAEKKNFRRASNPVGRHLPRAEESSA